MKYDLALASIATLGSLFGSYAVQAHAEQNCGKFLVEFEGNLSPDSSISQFEAVQERSLLETLPSAVVPLNSPILLSPVQIEFRFVRVAEGNWSVEYRVGANAEELRSTKFAGPFGEVSFDGSGHSTGISQSSLYMKAADESLGPVEISFGFGKMTAADGDTYVTFAPILEQQQACPSFGKALVSSEEAKTGQNRLRLFDPNGIEVSTADYDERGLKTSRQ